LGGVIIVLIIIDIIVVVLISHSYSISFLHSIFDRTKGTTIVRSLWYYSYK
jgi:hypothetical protein